MSVDNTRKITEELSKIAKQRDVNAALHELAIVEKAVKHVRKVLVKAQTEERSKLVRRIK